MSGTSKRGLAAVREAAQRFQGHPLEAAALGCGFAGAAAAALFASRYFNFEYHDPGIAGWVSEHRYPKQQDFAYYGLALVFVPLATLLFWLGCAALAPRTRPEASPPERAQIPVRPLRAVFQATALIAACSAVLGVFLSLSFLPASAGWRSVAFVYGIAALGMALLWLDYSFLASRASRRPFLECLVTDSWTYVPISLLLAAPFFYARRNALFFIALLTVAVLKLVNAERIRAKFGFRPERRIPALLTYVLVPSLIFVYLFSGDIHWPLNLYHDGEFLAPLHALLRGDVPYRDIYLQHGLLHNAWFPRLSAAWFGESLAGLRRLNVLMIPLFHVAIYFWGVQVFRSRWTAALCALVSFDPDMLRVERYLFSAVALACLGGWLRRRASSRLFCAGLFSVLAFFQGPDAGFYTFLSCVLFLSALRLLRSPGSGEPPGRPVVAFAAGAGLASAPFLAYFVWQGIASDFLSNLRAQLAYHVPVWGLAFPSAADFLKRFGQEGPAILLDGDFRWFYPVLVNSFAWALTARSAVSGGFTRSDRPARLLLLLLPASFFFLSVLGRSDSLHLDRNMVMVWPLSLFLFEALFLSGLEKWGAGARPAGLIACASAALFVAYLLRMDGTLDTVRGCLASPQSHFGLHGPVPSRLPALGPIRVPEDEMARIEAVVRYIQSATARDETIYDFSNQAAYHFLADRPSPTRYSQAVYAATRDMQEEVVRDIEDHRTKLVIYRTGGGFDRIDGVPTQRRLPLVDAYLRANYEPAKDVQGTILMLRRKKEPAG